LLSINVNAGTTYTLIEDFDGKTCTSGPANTWSWDDNNNFIETITSTNPVNGWCYASSDGSNGFITSSGDGSRYTGQNTTFQTPMTNYSYINFTVVSLTRTGNRNIGIRFHDWRIGNNSLLKYGYDTIPLGDWDKVLTGNYEVRFIDGNASVYINNSYVASNNYNYGELFGFEHRSPSTGSQNIRLLIDNFGTGLLDKNFTVTAKDLWNDTTINNFSILFNGTIYTTTNGVILTNITSYQEDLYDVVVFGQDYFNRTYDDYNITDDLEALLTPFPTARVYITFKNSDQEIINMSSISVEFISDNFSNFTTTNLSVTTLIIHQPENYTIRYYGEGYSERFSYLYIDVSETNLTLYLLNSSQADNISISVIDETGSEVVGAVVKALKYYVDTNNYLLQETGLTNDDGYVYMSLEKDTEYYKFMVQYDDRTIKTTTPDYIRSNELLIKVILGTPVGINYNRYESIDYSLTFNDVTNNFVLNYNSNDNSINIICMTTTKMTTLTNTVVAVSCESSTSATLINSITPINGTVFVTKVVYYDIDEDGNGRENFLDSITKSWSETINTGGLGLFLQMIITIIIVFIGFWNLPISAILTPLSLIIGRLIGLTSFSYEALVPLLIVGIIIAYASNRRT